MRCPDCKRDTLSKKWGSCTACGYRKPPPQEARDASTSQPRARGGRPPNRDYPSDYRQAFCYWCGKEFRAYKSQWYCSPNCRVAGYRAGKRTDGQQPSATQLDARGRPRLKLRFLILQRDGFRCHYCGRSAEEGAVLQIDHIKPRAKGGTDADDNLTTACRECNLGKGDSLLISP